MNQSQSLPAWLRLVPEKVRDLVAASLPAGLARPIAPTRLRTTPQGTFLSETFSSAAGARPYKLFVPSQYAGQVVPLVVMLHGCTQSPDDFALGTRMNVAAEEQVFLVAYPGQVASANAQKCWNWFHAGDQHRGAGEPSLIAGITRQVMARYSVDPRRVFVAGLSAGGAAAAIMGETYPDLFAAVGVHSGLPCGVATDMPSALAAMLHGSAGPVSNTIGQAIPTIIFHGDRDRTVSPNNADQVAARAAPRGGTQVQTRTGISPGGYPYRCSVRVNGAGLSVTEQWSIQGAGHAWSGGDPAGSYADPRGPDATSEMLRFFREHPRTASP